MKAKRLTHEIEPRDTIRWQGAQIVLDHSRRCSVRNASAFAGYFNKGT